MGGFAISDYQIDKVMELRNAGKTYAEIENEVGISSTAVWQIVTGKRTKSGDPDAIPTMTEPLPGEFKPKPKARLTRKVTVSGSVMTAISDGDTINLSVCDQNGIKLTYRNFKAMCEDAALMLESMLEREQRGIYSFE